ncbi:MAG: hypothetical protein M3O09_04270 [Acidobacteriota bacterium]|nr:hypothetical protein [Acidobacteriota bacterium]
MTDFISFIATSFKVPLLVETPAPVPNLDSPEGTYAARQLLDVAIAQLPGFAWKDEVGVAHVYQQRLVNSSGNILNVRIPHFAFPYDVGEFMYLFRPCIDSVIKGPRYEGFGEPDGLEKDDFHSSLKPSCQSRRTV